LVEDIFSELEIKIDDLILKVRKLKQEKNLLEQDIAVQSGKSRELETENNTLKEEVQNLKSTFEDQRKKIDGAAEKIQALLSKLESVD
jgi:seryl-tRNA synthetase